MNNKNNTHSGSKVTIQSELRPALITVSSNCDFERFQHDIDHIKLVLRISGAEDMAMAFALEKLSDAPQHRRNQAAAKAVEALHIEVLRHLLGLPSFRQYAMLLATSPILADFCGLLSIEGVKGTAKSSLERASKFFSSDQIKDLNQVLSIAIASSETCQQMGLQVAIDPNICLVDSTCFEANIHYPVDWVLLKDVAQNLLKAIVLIRREGLFNRMDEGPEELAAAMNQLCMQMAFSKRRKDGKKKRKKILRNMKTLLRRIGLHAEKHRDVLKEKHGQTFWSPRQSELIIQRIDEKLELLPKVIEQAHERIIGERKVASKDKILSAHEPDLHTIVRRKAGKEVEFGNELFLVETPEGFILDCHLYQEAAPSDINKLRAGLERLEEAGLVPKTVVADRGFDSRRMRREMEDAGIANMICPRNPAQLQERLGEPEFCRLQKRRGSTEARIAILKNKGGRVCRAKSFEHREQAVSQGMLAHNLLWLARQKRQAEEEAAREQASRRRKKAA